MHPVAKAIWYIESHFGRAIALSEIAAMAGMSRHHLSRRFSEMTGQNLNRYLRARRLSVAARQLAGGAQNILTVALEAGYGSHEAFTRAFREEFGLTPEALRARRDLSGLTLQEPIRMSTIDKSNLPSPRIETLDAFIIAGLGADFEPGKAAGRQAGAFPDVLEFYGEDFDPETGLGRVEIWLPLADQMTNS
ncbi:MAG: AraC family transcriptional regulator [Shinella sp.]